jgi:hypothetical protein
LERVNMNARIISFCGKKAEVGKRIAEAAQEKDRPLAVCLAREERKRRRADRKLTGQLRASLRWLATIPFVLTDRGRFERLNNG